MLIKNNIITTYYFKAIYNKIKKRKSKNKLLHSATEFKTNYAKKPSKKLKTYINMTLKTKHNTRYPEIHIGDNVKIYQNKKLCD